MLRRPRGLVRGTGTRGSDPWRRDANRDIARHPDRADTACADGRRRGGHTAASRLDRVGTPWKSYQEGIDGARYPLTARLTLPR